MNYITSYIRFFGLLPIILSNVVVCILSVYVVSQFLGHVKCIDVGKWGLCAHECDSVFMDAFGRVSMCVCVCVYAPDNRGRLPASLLFGPFRCIVSEWVANQRCAIPNVAQFIRIIGSIACKWSFDVQMANNHAHKE